MANVPSTDTTTEPPPSTHQALQPAPPTNPEISQIKSHLETIIRDNIHAINTRQLNPNLYPWTHMSPTYEFTQMYTGGPPGVRGKPALFENFRKILSAQPEIQFRIWNLETEVLVRKKKSISRARVFCSAEGTGMPGIGEGMCRKSVTVFEFRLIKGVWMMVKEETIMGKCFLEELIVRDG